MEGETHEIGRRLDVREGSSGEPATGRPWLQTYFACSGQYVRVYRNPDGSGYVARCPSCAKSIRFKVGEGGTQQRFFTVSCR